MSVFDCARLVIYRVNKKGLEIFLLSTDSEDKNWKLPQGDLMEINNIGEKIIELEPITQNNGQIEKALAVEAEWHEIPSVRALIKEDVRIVKAELKNKFPELEHGTYVAVKEAVKRVLPEEYALLKELKDVIRERNQVKYI